MIKYIENKDINILDINTLNSFRKAKSEYIINKKDIQKKKNFIIA